jgi:hypothetical protein
VNLPCWWMFGFLIVIAAGQGSSPARSERVRRASRDHDFDRHNYRLAERCWSRSKLVLVQILIGNVVLRDLMSVHFPRVLIVGLLHSRDRAGFKGVSFFN